MTQLSVRRAGRRRLRARVSILLVAAIMLLLMVSRAEWLPWIGEWLVSPDAPEPADLIVVLGGDFWGQRVVRAAELGVQGYAPHVMISGPDYVWHGTPVPEGEMAINFLLGKGYPRELFWAFPHHAASTIEEAKLLAREFKLLRVKRVLIVTSNYHSRRASLVFHALLPSLQIRVIGAPEENFHPESWWKARVSRRLAKSEWSKIMGTIAVSWILRLQAMQG